MKKYIANPVYFLSRERERERERGGGGEIKKIMNASHD